MEGSRTEVRIACDPSGLAVKTYGFHSDLAESEIREDAAKLRRNALLEEIHRDVYRRILAEVPAARFPRLLEVGSGGGFFRDFAPHAITSECVGVEGIDKVVDACRPSDFFEAGSLDAISGFNVFHHLPDAAGCEFSPSDQRLSGQWPALRHVGKFSWRAIPSACFGRVTTNNLG